MFVAGTAFAYWTATGAGTGSATTTTTTPMTVAQIGTVPSAMYPGGPDQAISYSVTNPAAFPQQLTAVVVAVDSVVTNPGNVAVPTCTAADFAITQPAAINADIPAGTTSYNSTGALIHMKNNAVSQNTCKNTKVILSFSIAE
ncbi:hypothetical protein [Actinoplanes sp. NPDC051494]|uniref:hypothetical protein n=1 Tax=Actinoplanes sp. NPDC051494 TaxID=3363907 RepID=UPI0037AC1A4B